MSSRSSAARWRRPFKSRPEDFARCDRTRARRHRSFRPHDLRGGNRRNPAARHRGPRRLLREGASGASPPLSRARLHRLHRLHGSRQLRHQYPGWRPVRLSAALGRHHLQPDGDAGAVALREAGHRLRDESAGDDPAGVSASPDLGALDAGRSGGDGDRSRGVPRRGRGVLSALRHPALAGGASDRRRDLRHPRPAAVRLPPAGGGHHRLRRRHRHLLPDRNDPGPPGFRRRAGCRAATPLRRDRDACCWPPASSAPP